LPVVSPACRLFFHIVQVQFKISLEEIRHICRRLGADQPPLWRSLAWELYKSCGGSCHQCDHFRRPDGFRFSQLSPAGAWMLAAPTIYAAERSPHGTTSDRPIPQSNSTKIVVRHCEFSEKFEILEKHHVSNDATENAWFMSNLACLPGNGP
jgi:hypothetical protein